MPIQLLSTARRKVKNFAFATTLAFLPVAFNQAIFFQAVQRRVKGSVRDVHMVLISQSLEKTIAVIGTVIDERQHDRIEGCF